MTMNGITTLVDHFHERYSNKIYIGNIVWFSSIIYKPEYKKCKQCNGIGKLYAKSDRKEFVPVICSECRGEGILNNDYKTHPIIGYGQVILTNISMTIVSKDKINIRVEYDYKLKEIPYTNRKESVFYIITFDYNNNITIDSCEEKLFFSEKDAIDFSDNILDSHLSICKKNNVAVTYKNIEHIVVPDYGILIDF